jgi:hypothetical protein
MSRLQKDNSYISAGANAGIQNQRFNCLPFSGQQLIGGIIALKVLHKQDWTKNLKEKIYMSKNMFHEDCEITPLRP